MLSQPRKLKGNEGGCSCAVGNEGVTIALMVTTTVVVMVLTVLVIMVYSYDCVDVDCVEIGDVMVA